MQVVFRLWAQMRVKEGRAEVEMNLPEGIRLGEALRRFYEKHPRLAGDGRIARAAVGNEYVGDDHPLRDGDEISLIPPVQGG